MIVENWKEPKEPSKPAYSWGVTPWTTRDGMTPEKAQQIIQRCVDRVQNEAFCARFLGVGDKAIGVYLKNAQSIPRGVGEKVMRLHAVCQTMPQQRKPTKRELERFAEEEQLFLTVSERNSEACARAGRMVADARTRAGMTIKATIEKIGMTGYELKHIESRGVTPFSRLFFPLFELFGLNPEDCGFCGGKGEAIKRWRRNKTMRSAKQ